MPQKELKGTVNSGPGLVAIRAWLHWHLQPHLRKFYGPKTQQSFNSLSKQLNCFFGFLRRVMAIWVYFNGNNFGPDFILTEYLLYTSPQHSIINNPGSHLKAPSPIWFYSDFRYHHPHSTQLVIQPSYWILITQSLMAVKFRRALKTAIQNKYFLCTWRYIIQDISPFVILMS